jgi:23S rRNA (adenine2030-N6)-methyltransferase
MLSYRHAFHAGNHADVLKHAVLIECLSYMNQKDKPYCYVDTHAGAGKYLLTEGYAAQNAEFETGIGKLWQRDDLPPMLRRYVAVIKSCQQTSPASSLLRFYPGSPLIASRVMRETDTLRLFETHPTDFPLLKRTMDGVPQKVQCVSADGFNGIKSVLPPLSRRGLILIDPSYELKTDYRNVITALKEGLKRFATGTFVVWYPLLKRPEVPRMLDALGRLDAEKKLSVSFTVQKPSPDGFGMYGSGLFLINPPWTLEEQLKTTMPYVVKMLGNRDGGYSINTHS